MCLLMKRFEEGLRMAASRQRRYLLECGTPVDAARRHRRVAARATDPAFNVIADA